MEYVIGSVSVSLCPESSFCVKISDLGFIQIVVFLAKSGTRSDSGLSTLEKRAIVNILRVAIFALAHSPCSFSDNDGADSFSRPCKGPRWRR